MSQDRIRPKVITLPPGRHAICACGQSAKAPFCDGTHKGTGFTPVMEVVEGLPKNIAWCACHTTGNAPYCDGSHTALWTDEDAEGDDSEGDDSEGDDSEGDDSEGGGGAGAGADGA